jgi:AcrR family transcriptional regulator
VAASAGRRQAQAAQTRREIVAAARRLFAAGGYRSTTIKDVAAAAGVSVQTVYDSVGAKRDLVLALNDLIDDESGVAAISARAATERDPAALLAVPAAITRALLEHCGDIVRAGLAAAGEDAELAAAAAEGRRRHLAGAARLAGRLAELGAIPAGTAELVAGTVAAITDSSFGVMLLDHYGWSLDRVEAFMAATACGTVLGDQGGKG